MAEAKSALKRAASSFAGDALRDVWVFDETDHEVVYLREDVSERVEDIDVAVYIDNERMGYVTRDTYEALAYVDYQYTVRGFDAFVQFRTFVPGKTGPVGVYISFDAEGSYDFSQLNESIQEAIDETDAPLSVGD